MTDYELDPEIATIARKLATTIDNYLVVWPQLEAIEKKIKNHLDNPKSEKFNGLLKIIASGANSAAIMSESCTSKIRSLSFTLYSLLGDEETEK